MWTNNQTSERNWVVRLTSPAALLVVGLVSLAAALLFTGHGNYLVDALFYLPIVGCLLMHLFMHHGHHHHRLSDKGGRND